MPPRSWPLIALLVLAPVLCWAWIVVLARDMYGPMTGASAWMMTPRWNASHLFLLWMMWAVMMTGMMLPSAAPVVVLIGGRAAYFVALGYVAAWAVFSAGATLLQWLLLERLLVTPMMEASSRGFSAALLALAGLYQLTPLKHACLSTCRSPVAYLMRRWRGGAAGAFRMGLGHGASCVGCCWALMLLLFAGGVMNLAVIAALTVFVALEKLLPLGRWAAWSARLSGVALIGLAAWIVVQPS